MNHLLVVDDSPLDRRLVGGLLQRGGKHHVEFASTGLEALEQLDERLPLAVITDLQMPEMDGLALVEAMHRKYPQVPVILMTAHGSEETALQALLAGAADFVPKLSLASDLCRAVDSVLSVSGANRSQQKLTQCLQSEERRYELDNDPLLIPPLVGQVRQTATEMGAIDAADGMRLAKALVEGLKNAIYHGNLELALERTNVQSQPTTVAADEQLLAERRQLEPFRSRRVRVHTQLSSGEARVRIQDEGPGFDTRRVPNARFDPAHLTRSEGRGLVLISAFMDEVRFNEQGNELTLVKRGHGGVERERHESLATAK